MAWIKTQRGLHLHLDQGSDKTIFLPFEMVTVSDMANYELDTKQLCMLSQVCE